MAGAGSRAKWRRYLIFRDFTISSAKWFTPSKHRRTGIWDCQASRISGGAFRRTHVGVMIGEASTIGRETWFLLPDRSAQRLSDREHLTNATWPHRRSRTRILYRSALMARLIRCFPRKE